MFILDTISCGNGAISGLDSMVPAFTSTVVTVIKVAIPIFLIIYGMLDLGKAVMSNDEKVMKTAQSTFIKRIIYAVIIFFIVAIVQLVFGMLARASSSSDSSNTANAAGCIDCFINGADKCK